MWNPQRDTPSFPCSVILEVNRFRWELEEVSPARGVVPAKVSVEMTPKMPPNEPAIAADQLALHLEVFSTALSKALVRVGFITLTSASWS
jgi:hypothetical protein